MTPEAIRKQTEDMNKAFSDYVYQAGKLAKLYEVAIDEQEKVIAVNGHCIVEVTGEEGYFIKGEKICRRTK